MSDLLMPLGVTAVMLPDLDFDEQIALCSRLGVTHYSLRPRVIPDEQRDKPWSNWGNHKFDLTPQRLAKEGDTIRRRLLDAGMVAFGTVPAVKVNEVDSLELHFEGAAKVQAGRVRVAPMPYPQGHFDFPAWLDQTVDQFKKAVEMARPYNLKLVMETHARSLVAGPGLAWSLCRAFEPSELGVIFDIANFNIEGNLQPNLAVAVLNEYIDHAHVGGVRSVGNGYDPQGCHKSVREFSPLSESHLYIPDWIGALHAAGRHVPLLVENFTLGVPGELRLTESVATLKRILATLSEPVTV